MSGFIALHRESTEHPLFIGNAERFGAWFWLVAKAVWKPTRFSISGATITLERGQLCASRTQLAAAWGWSPSAVERFLTRLQTEQMIGRATGQGRSVITICNYSKYQDGGDDTGQATEQPFGQRSDSDRTTKEQGNKETIEEETYVSPSSASERANGEEADRGGKNPAPAKPKRTCKPDPALPDWMPAAPWQGFLEMRAAAGKPPTPRAIELLIGKLDGFRRRGHDPTAVLDQSTINRWLDVYEPKDNRNGSSANRTSSAGARNGPAGGGRGLTVAQQELARIRSAETAEQDRRRDAAGDDGAGFLPLAGSGGVSGW